MSPNRHGCWLSLFLFFYCNLAFFNYVWLPCSVGRFLLPPRKVYVQLRMLVCLYVDPLVHMICTWFMGLQTIAQWTVAQ